MTPVSPERLHDIAEFVIHSNGMATDPDDNRLYDALREKGYRPHHSRAVQELVRAVPELLTEIKRLQREAGEVVVT